MKNKKGQAIGGLIIFAVMIIVATAFLSPIFSSQAQMTATYKLSNTTIVPAAASSSVYLTGQDLIGTPSEVLNQSGATINCAGNFTFSEVVRTDTGVKGIVMTSKSTLSSVYCSKVNVSYEYGGEGYVDDAGGRGMASMIGLFSVLALLAGAIFYWYKEGGFEFLKG
jgi:hypothetical protein